MAAAATPPSPTSLLASYLYASSLSFCLPVSSRNSLFLSSAFALLPHTRCSLGQIGPLDGCGNGSPWHSESCEVTHKGPSWKWRLVISYDGTKYAGWQLQEGTSTVQLILEAALTKVTRLSRESMLLTAASRTDSGVHAWGQVAHFKTPFPLKELQSFHTSLNCLLPNDIRIREVAAVQELFHSRYSAKRKMYQYKIYCNPVMDPFQWRYAFHVRDRLNVNAMRDAARSFIGEHNFMAFANVARHNKTEDFVREIYRFEVIEKDLCLILEVEGSGFFYKQVRNMVGLLLEIGKELVPPSAVCKILTSRSRKLLSLYAPTAPPHGLVLMYVTYDKAILEPPIGSPLSSYGSVQTHQKCKVFFQQ